eukprot:TRINITY_DN90845_c0_g1_i1.p1 TRINITY_DN90845_c0_g1~~TRINITY_DN90845_c0_g1_i1.p1  ORF type:complete len:541 (+),score=125.84 TRINITY_DN90845_c0_g1_i1:68-1690(+)
MAGARKKPAANSVKATRKKAGPGASKKASAGKSVKRKPAASSAAKRLASSTAAATSKRTKKISKLFADVSKPLRKVLYIMRGAPGCGKSTVARQLLAQHLAAQGLQWDHAASGAAFSPVCRAFVFSTDDYFTEVHEDGSAEYIFDPRRLSELHKANQARCQDAMRLGRTPIFVDNTNIQLWEMAAYLKIGEKHGYSTMVIGSEQLGPEASNAEKLFARCAKDKGARADGKNIPLDVFSKMIDRYEKLPDGAQGVTWEPAAAALQLIRDSKSPFEGPQKPRYAGLDTEVQVLEGMGTLKLSSQFWNAADKEDSNANEAQTLTGSLLEARSSRRWRLPDRLHITVSYWGPNGTASTEVEEYIGKIYDVCVRALVFVRGGGLMCAACSLPDGASALAKLAGGQWRPHITLMTSQPWQAVESNALLAAWEEAAAKTNSEPEQLPETQLDSPEDLQEQSVTKDREKCDTSVMQDCPQCGHANLATAVFCRHCGMTFRAAVGASEDACSLKTYPAVKVCDRTVDICVLPLDPPLQLGSCRFRTFIW